MKASALIIGNAKYPDNTLDNPENDANDFAKTLDRLGFKTLVQLNADSITQDKTITDFATNLNSYDVGLFYFAGHGFQLDNDNYLAAIDTDFKDPEHAKHSSFPLNILLSYLNKSSNRTSIIILDACRNQLNKKSWYRSVEDAGLAPILAPKGTIIAYATSPGEKALDGTGNRNGVYTGSLLQHIIAKDIPIEEMFKRVRNSVYAFSKGKQTSWEHTSLTGTFYFNSGQLSHSSSIEYSSQVIKDSLYKISYDSIIDDVISGLKSHNWYFQNPAMGKLLKIDASEEDKNKLFLVGRNILQSACGGANSASTFMDNLENHIIKFNSDNNNHILNGIIYETFFDAYGSFRQNNIKDQYLEEIYKALENKVYSKNLVFLNTILHSHKDFLFYIPSLNSTGISLDVEFESDAQQDEVILKSIKFEGEEILIKQEFDDIWGIPHRESHTILTYKKLKKRIAEEIFIPAKKLTINSNIKIEDERIIKYPSDYKLMK